MMRNHKLRSIILTMVALAVSCTAFAHPGVGIVVDKSGNVYYTDLKQVWRLETNGRKSVAVPDVHTHELYLDEQGNLFGEHLWYSGPQDGSGKYHFRVWMRSPDGKVSDIVPPTEGFRKYVSFVRDKAGNMYAGGESEADSTKTVVRKIDPSGHATRLAGGAKEQSDGTGTAAGFTSISWMAVGQDGMLYVIDAGAIRRVTPEGKVTTLVRGIDEGTWTAILTQRRHYLMGLTADPEGNVYVANFGSGKVKKVGKDGHVTIFDRSILSWAPTGVALSGNKVYILEYSSTNEVQVRSVKLRPSK